MQQQRKLDVQVPNLNQLWCHDGVSWLMYLYCIPQYIKVPNYLDGQCVFQNNVNAHADISFGIPHQLSLQSFSFFSLFFLNLFYSQRRINGRIIIVFIYMQYPNNKTTTNSHPTLNNPSYLLCYIIIFVCKIYYIIQGDSLIV